MRFYAAVTFFVCLFVCFFFFLLFVFLGKKFVPPPHFSAPSYATDFVCTLYVNYITLRLLQCAVGIACMQLYLENSQIEV